MDKKRIAIIVSIILCGIFLLLFGPMDVFTHGFYPDEIDVGQIADIDKIGQINVNDQNCKVIFSPKNDLFAGLEIFLVNQVPENGGTMTMKIADSNGKQIDEIEIDLSKVKDSVWYKVCTNADLKKGKQYTVTFDVANTDTIPSFLLINPDYLGDENIQGNVLISYAYSQSTFSNQEKVMIYILIIALLGLVLYFLIPDQRYRKVSKVIILFLILTVGMTWNFMYNSFDNQNKDFLGFQSDSETLATGVIYAERDGISFLRKTDKGYGLGRYSDLKGTLKSYGLSYISNDDWIEGYGKTIPAIVVNSNAVTKKIAVAGNIIQFKNGEEYQITEIVDDGKTIIINLNAERPLSQARNGSLDDCIFFDANHQAIDKSLITGYESQYGLQGKVFRHMARHMDKEDAIINLNLICAIATASVLVLIVLLLNFKYDTLFAGCFYIGFALSPWVVNFARNLYWVEFTWFIPMAVGIICSLKIESRKWRIACYLATFIAIVGKCLCGYEYISVVMMGLVSFMVFDLLIAMVKKDCARVKLLFRTTVIMGVIALIGFMVAICIHASLKGSGSIIEGIQKIIEKDVLRRTNGADLNDLNPIYWPSMNASVWEVYSKYFHFSSEIITGITGNMFPILCVVPIVIFVFEYRRKKYDFQSIFMYVFFFLTSISWFCLAKSHSYIHTHINYVLWYFGFVQICIYIIVSRIVGCFPIKVKDENTMSGSIGTEVKKQEEKKGRKKKK